MSLGKAFGLLISSKVIIRAVEFFQENPALAAALISVSVVIILFILYSFFKKKN